MRKSQYNIKIEDIKYIIESKEISDIKEFTAKDLAYLGTLSNWKNKSGYLNKNKRKKIILNMLNIDKTFDGEGIGNLNFAGIDMFENKDKSLIILKKIKLFNFGKVNISGILNSLFQFEKKGGNIDLFIENLINIKKDNNILKDNELYNLLYLTNNNKEKVLQILKYNSLKYEEIYNFIKSGLSINKLDKYTILLKKGVSIKNSIVLIKNNFNLSDYNNFYKKYSILNKNNPLFLLSKIGIVQYNNFKKQLTNKNLESLASKYLEKTNLSENYGEHQFKKNLFELSKIKNIGSLLEFLEKNEINIKIGKNQSKINGNLQHLRGILTHLNKNLKIDENIDWKDIIKSYGELLESFIEVNKKIDTVYFLGPNHYYGESDDFSTYNKINIIKKIYNESNIIDFTQGTTQSEKLTKTNEIINLLENDLKKGKNISFYISLHGNTNGSTPLLKGGLNKKDFYKINKLADKYRNLKVVIDSCNNDYKVNDKNKKGNIISNSGEYFSNVIEYGDKMRDSYKIGDDGFKLGDYNKDGILTPGESDLFTILGYQSGGIDNNGLVSFYRNENGNKKEIAKNIF